MFFDLCGAGRLAGKGARLVDTNADLIGCYRALVQNVEGVIRNLKRLTTAHAAAPAEHYYRVRDELFNPVRRERNAAGRPGDYPAKLAAMFIYLNRTGFNGLYRLNSQGAFNVPAGRYANPRICDAPNLRAVARALASPGVALERDGYESVLQAASAGDLIYFDPPYAPLSTTASFTSYTAGGFSDRRPAAPSGGRPRIGRPRLLGRAEQLDGADHRGPLRDQPTGEARRATRPPGSGQAGDQLGPDGTRRRDGVHHHERPADRLTMAGKATAVHSGAELRDRVAELGRALGLDARTEVRVARRLWGAVRCIDVVLTRTETGKTLGIECKYQGGGGSAEEKVPATIQDIAAWPIPGIVVFGGERVLDEHGRLLPFDREGRGAR